MIKDLACTRIMHDEIDVYRLLSTLAVISNDFTGVKGNYFCTVMCTTIGAINIGA